MGSLVLGTVSFPSPHLQLLPSCGQLQATFSLPKLTDAAFPLHFVVEFVLQFSDLSPGYLLDVSDI